MVAAAAAMHLLGVLVVLAVVLVARAEVVVLA
jgi:hypothetical protein